MPLRAYPVHHLRVAHAHLSAFHTGLDAMSRYLLHVSEPTTIGGLIGKGGPQGFSYGMGREMLHVSRQVQQLPLIEIIGVDSRHRELTIGKCARLVKHHGAYLGQGVHVTTALHQDAFTGSPAQATKESERHADDQGAGTRYHQEHQSPLQPRGENVHETPRGKQRGQYGQQQRANDHNGRIDAGETGDKGFAFRLPLVRALHQADNLRHRALAKTLGHPHMDNARQVDASRHHVISLAYVARQALTRQGHGVEGGGSLCHGAVQGHFLPRLHHNLLPRLHLLGRYGKQFAASHDVGHVGANLHQVLDAVTALALGIALEELSHLEEEHHEDSLGKFRFGSGHEANAERAQRGHRHQEVLIERLAPPDAFPRLAQRLSAYQQVGHQVDQEQLPRLQATILLYQDRCHQ